MAAYKMNGFQRFLLLRCFIWNIIMYVIFNLKMLFLVAKGHGGTRD